MKVKQKQTLRYTLGLFSALVIAASIVSGIPSTVNALTNEQCVSRYGSLNPASETDIQNMRDDGCQAPDGPCDVTYLLGAPGGDPSLNPAAISCNIQGGGDGETPQLTEAQCKNKYHGKELSPDQIVVKESEMAANGCSDSCSIATKLGGLPVIDCTGEFAQDNQHCSQYTGAEKEACKTGYNEQISACDQFSGREKEACEYGARQSGGQNGCQDEACGEDEEDGCETSIIPCTDVWGLLNVAIYILTAGVGVLAVGGIVYGAILYTSAGDRSDQVKKAIGIITNVVIGLVAYVAMFAIVQFLIPGGIW